MAELKKIFWLGTFLFALSLGAVAQEAELINNHQPEEIWYLEPWLWIGSGILLLLIMMSVLYRISKSKKEPEFPAKSPPVEGENQDSSVHPQKSES